MCFGDGQPAPGGVPPLTGDGDKQSPLILELNNTLENSSGGRDVFTVDLDKATLVFKRQPTPGSQTQRIIAEKGRFAPLTAQLFTDDFEISCQAKSAPKPNQQKNPENGSGEMAGGGIGAASSGGPVPSWLRLRGKPEDLAISRDSDAFAGVSTTSFAVVNDVAAQENTFDAHMTAGVVLPNWESNGTVLQSIPFFQYDRSYVDGGKAPPNSTNVNNVGVGVQETLTFPTGGFYSSLSAQPTFVSSLRSNVELFKLRVASEPQPLIPFIGLSAETPIPGVWATAYTRAVVSLFDVARPANDNSITTRKSFAQGGTELGTTFSVKDDNSSFNGVSVPISYTALYGFSGPYRSLGLFQAAINYTLLGLSYTLGNNLDTFEQQKVYKASIGVKY